MKQRVVLLLPVGLFVGALALGACGGTSNNPQPQPEGGVSPEGGSQPDGGTVVPGYPAAHNPAPAMVNAGGPILTAIKIVTVTFPNDAMATRLEQFGDTITQSDWWSQTTSEYGIGKGTAGVHVRLATPAAATYTDSANGGPSTVQELIQAHVADGTFPAPTTQTLYAIYFPATTSITIDGNGKSCTEFGGYHISVDVTPPGGAKMTVPYAIVPRCADQVTRQVTEAGLTAFASHEILEAATNVTPTLVRGWAMAPTSAWGATLPESGDLCHNDELASQIAFKRELNTDIVMDSTFAVQRGWSNASAAANHDPCVPRGSAVYFNASPKVDAFSLAVGASATLEVTAFSEGPTDAWTVSAFDFGTLLGLGKTLTFAWDRTTVNNSDKVNLTVTLTAAPMGGETLFWIISKGADRAHMWPVVVIKK